jgi:hypothetical protein
MRTQRPGESALLLLDAVELLRKESVQYAVIGAMAASIHGVARASMDADAVLSVGVQRLGELKRTFEAASFQAELRRGDEDDPIAAVLLVNDTFGNRVDLLVGLRGLEPAAFSRAIEVPFMGERLRIIGREDFIAMKLFAHGPQDVEDARFAFAAAQGSIDVQLLQRLASRYGADTVDALDRLIAHGGEP